MPLGSAVGLMLILQAQPVPVTYAIRADPVYATALTRVIAEIGVPVTVRLAAGQTAADYFQSTCGGPPAGGHREGVGNDGSAITFAPCVRIRSNARASAIRGSRLEGMAIRFGLSPAAVGQLEIYRGPEAARVQAMPANELQVGDIVVAPKAADWTVFSVKPELALDRAALTARLAAAIDCPPLDAETCLVAHRVLLLDPTPANAPTPKVDPSGGDASPEASVPEPSSIGEESVPLTAPPTTLVAEQPPPGFSLGRLIGGLIGLGPVAASELRPVSDDGPTAAPEPAFSSEEPLADEPSALDATPVAAPEAAARPPVSRSFAPVTAALLEQASVSPDQWPYNPDQIARVLQKSRAEFGPDAQPLVGVADGGLADALGAPLPPEMFARIASDNDEQWIGSGVEREDRNGPGDVSLCETGLDLSGWPADTIAEASHGALVAGLAGGYRLRQAHPDVQDSLPHVHFYRLVSQFCAPGEAPITTVAAALAYDYLSAKTPIIVLSLLSSSPRSDALTNMIAASATSNPGLLFLAAGNEPKDLDKPGKLLCPACLARPGDPAEPRVVLVGSAGRDLRRAPRTAWGERTVRLFAPADTSGLVNVARQRIDGSLGTDAYLPWTSYAAPHAALAAAFLESAGLKSRGMNYTLIRQRLMLASWGLRGSGDQARVVDLLKVVSSRYDTVEVLELIDGAPVLTTYVGRIASGTDTAGCQLQVSARKAQAIRFQAPNENGSREADYFRRTFTTPKTEEPDAQIECAPTGDIALVDIDGVDRVIPWSSVTQIIFPWRLS